MVVLLLSVRVVIVVIIAAAAGTAIASPLSRVSTGAAATGHLLMMWNAANAVTYLLSIARIHWRSRSTHLASIRPSTTLVSARLWTRHRWLLWMRLRNNTDGRSARLTGMELMQAIVDGHAAHLLRHDVALDFGNWLLRYVRSVGKLGRLIELYWRLLRSVWWLLLLLLRLQKMLQFLRRAGGVIHVGADLYHLRRGRTAATTTTRYEFRCIY